MIKEQDKAIERCNKLIETEHSNWIGITNQKAIETVLNMLKEKDEEINKYKRKNKELSNQLLKIYKEEDNYNARIEKKNAQIEKKDKMINLMLDKLNQGCKVFEKDEIKEIVEIYEKIKSTSDLRGIELRKDCLNQYFERKATNDA